MKPVLCLVALFSVASAGFLGSPAVHTYRVVEHRPVAHLDDATIIGVLAALNHGSGGHHHQQHHHSGGGLDDATLAAIIATQTAGSSHSTHGSSHSTHGSHQAHSRRGGYLPH